MSVPFVMENVGHLVPYILFIFLFLAFALYGDITRSKAGDWLILCLLILFAGVRGTLTPDLERYRELFEEIGAGNGIEIEPSFTFLSHALHWIGLDYHALFFVYTVITILFTYFAIRNFTDQSKFALLLYAFIPACMLNLFVEMRETSAIAVTFFALSLSRKGKELKFVRVKMVILAIGSCLLHFSALMFWIILFLGKAFFSKKHSRPLYLCTLIASFLIPTSALITAINVVAYPILPGKYQAYINTFLLLETNLAQSGQVLKSFIYSMLALVFAFWATKRASIDTDQLSVNLFFVGVVLLNITRSFADISRVSYFFLIFQLILWPRLLSTIRSHTQSMLAAYAVVLFYFAQFGWGVFFYSTEVGSYVYLNYRNPLFSLGP